MSIITKGDQDSVLDQVTISLIQGITPAELDRKFGNYRVSPRMGVNRYVETLFQCGQLEKREGTLYMKPEFIPPHLRTYARE